MLVLNRRVNESLVIGTDIVLTILAIGANEAKIGIAAPLDVSVNRQETHERIKDDGFRHEDTCT
jgi:carbon storage regulator